VNGSEGVEAKLTRSTAVSRGPVDAALKVEAVRAPRVSVIVSARPWTKSSACSTPPVCALATGTTASASKARIVNRNADGRAGRRSRIALTMGDRASGSLPRKGS
jgi:hypothetical protein